MAATRWGFVALVALSLAPAGPVGAVESISARIDTLNVRLRQTRYAEADSGARALLRIVEAAQGSRSLEAANVLDVLVEALLDQGKSASPETRTLALRAVAIKEKLLGPRHADVARMLGNLAEVIQREGKLDEATELFRRSLAIKLEVYGPKHPLTAYTLHGLPRLRGLAPNGRAHPPRTRDAHPA